MFTIFSCPKPFQGQTNIVQRNAIKSWTLLKPKPEIILIGDEIGTAGICKEFNLRHIPLVDRNKLGTPLISSIFEIGQSNSTYSTVCYINTDIIVMSDFSAAIKKYFQSNKKCVMAGSRSDINITDQYEFLQNWEDALRSKVKKIGKLNRHAIDYFIFQRNFFTQIPLFAIGRNAWDNWLIYFACLNANQVIDATEAIMAVHQNHDYCHVDNAKGTGLSNSEEADYNIQIAEECRLDIENSTHIVINNHIARNVFASIFIYIIRLYKVFPALKNFLYRKIWMMYALDIKILRILYNHD